jgi:ankyrin repeat protein
MEARSETTSTACAKMNMGQRRKALFKAVQDEDLTEINKLIDSGVHVNIGDDDGWTPLHFACIISQLLSCSLREKLI